MRLITRFNNLQESYDKLKIEFSKSEAKNKELINLNNQLISQRKTADSNYIQLRDKIVNTPEQILYHIKLYKIENYIRKNKLKKLNSK